MDIKTTMKMEEKKRNGKYKCSRCQEYLEKNEFYKNCTKKYGIHDYCKDCLKEYNYIRYHNKYNNDEEYRKRCLQLSYNWRKNNPEKYKEIMKDNYRKYDKPKHDGFKELKDKDQLYLLQNRFMELLKESRES